LTLVLTASFILMATIALLIMFKSKTNPILKAILTIVTIWYGIALYALPGHFMGFPKVTNTLPDKAWVLAHKVVEPSGMDKGGMYFWIIETKVENGSKLNPLTFFQIIDSRPPRAYVLPYNKEMNKQLQEAAKGQKGKDGSPNGKMMRFKSAGDDSGDKEKQGKFEIINPVDLLPPKD
jgi:hypothetical protein